METNALSRMDLPAQKLIESRQYICSGKATQGQW